MNIILLSGGSGKRLWPLSNEIRSKQFIRIFAKEDGSFESMVERIYRNIEKVMPGTGITVATGKAQASTLFNQLGNKVDVCVEPARRDTFPAICLAASYLKYEKHLSDDEPIIVCPVDPYVQDDYFEALKNLSKQSETNGANITLMGMEPTYPSEKYGYIIPGDDGFVKEFKEKPDVETAQKYIEQGAFWNGGVFAMKLGYIIDKAHETFSFADYNDLNSKYTELTKISFDYAVVEKETKIKVMPFSGAWKDLGTWNTLTEAMETNIIGKAVMSESCENTHIVNELDIPVLVMGAKNVVVAASPDGILVSDKNESSYMKPFVDKIEGPVMFAEKSWGNYLVMDVEEASMTVKVTLLPGHKMNYHRHEHRDEVWNIIEGKGHVIVDGVEREVKAGDVIMLPKGTKHTIIADTKLKVMEIQIGDSISVEDKIKENL